MLKSLLAFPGLALCFFTCCSTTTVEPEIVFIHLVNAYNGSFIKLKSYPNTVSNVSVTATYQLPAAQSSPTQNLAQQLAFGEDGLAKIPLNFNTGVVPARLNLSAQSTTVTVSTEASYTTGSDVYYPVTHITMNVSMVKLAGTWQPVWDAPSETWQLDPANPQVLQLVQVTSTHFTVFCLVCAQGLSSTLGNYTINFMTASGGEQQSAISLFKRDTLESGELVTNISGINTADFSYMINFTYFNGTDLVTIISSHGQSLSEVKNTRYPNVYKYDNVVYINEVHLQRNISKSNSDEKEFWMELVAPSQYNLRNNFCLQMSITNPQGHVSSSSCFLLKDVVFNDNGFNVWSPVAGTDDDVKSFMSGMFVRGSQTSTIKLIRQYSDQWVVVDRVSFRYVYSSSDPCTINTDAHRTTDDNHTLCVDITFAGADRDDTSLSRCGMIKNIDSMDMSVWYLKPSTKKIANICSRPGAYIKEINFDSGTVTVSTNPDLATVPLTSMGLQLLMWHRDITDTEKIIQIPLKGTDLSIDVSPDDSPINSLNIIIQKKGVLAVHGTDLYASGASITPRPSLVYGLTLVQYYTFMPNLTVDNVKDAVVDAVVYSVDSTPHDLGMITHLMPQISSPAQLLFPARNLVIQRKMSSDANGLLVPSNWEQLAQAGQILRLPMFTLTDAMLERVRISRVGNIKNPDIELTALSLPDELMDCCRDGIPLDELEVVIQEPVSRNPYFRSDPLTGAKLKPGEPQIFRGAIMQSDPITYGTVFYVVAYQSVGSDITAMHLSDNDIKLNGKRPVALEETRFSKTIDMMKLQYSDPTSTNRYAVSTDAIPYNETVEPTRCYSTKPFLTTSFVALAVNAECPTPYDLYIYKLCQGRVGITSDSREDFHLPTDYLYLYQYDTQKKIVKVLPVKRTYSVLKWKHTLIVNGTYSLRPTNNSVTAYGLGWFTNGAPTIGQTLENSTLSILVVYPSQDSATVAKDLWNIGVESMHNPSNSELGPTIFSVNENDWRHCIIRCNRASSLTPIIDYESNITRSEDKICDSTIADYTAQYRSLRINEINADTKGFSDIGEYVELSGPAGFVHASGLSLAVISVDKNVVEYSFIQKVQDGKRFDIEGFFLFVKDVAAANDTATQQFTMNRILPNKYGAVALLWGADLIPSIQPHQPIQRQHVSIPDLFLDVVIYAQNQSTSSSHDPNVQRIRSLFLSSGPNSKSIQGSVAIETMNAVNGNETISRCFCNDTWNMDCFEMSFNETRKRPNICPTKHRMQMSICYLNNDVSAVASYRDTLKEKILQFMANSPNCLDVSCSFSTHQILGVDGCLTEGYDSTKLIQVSFTLGFPSAVHLEKIGGTLSSDALRVVDPEIVDCGGAKCQITPSSSQSSHGLRQQAGLIGGVIGGLVFIVIVAIVVIIVIRRRKAYRRALSARFEASNDDEDDDSFIPDGRISFSNPWYEKTSARRTPSNSSTNSNGSASKPDYRKLQQLQ